MHLHLFLFCSHQDACFARGRARRVGAADAADSAAAERARADARGCAAAAPGRGRGGAGRDDCRCGCGSRDLCVFLQFTQAPIWQEYVQLKHFVVKLIE